jgi:hypothetical protein
MAIAPIDLQTLFTQLDKVAKTQNAQKDGHVLQQSLQNTQLQRKAEANVQQVNEAQNTGDGVEKIKDKESERKHHADGQRREEEREEEEDEANEEPSIVRDPSLGKKIDISL